MANDKKRVKVKFVKVTNHPNVCSTRVQAIDVDTGEVYAEENFNFGWHGIHNGHYIESLKSWATRRYLVDVLKEGRVPENLLPKADGVLELDVGEEEIKEEERKMKRGIKDE